MKGRKKQNWWLDLRSSKRFSFPKFLIFKKIIISKNCVTSSRVQKLKSSLGMDVSLGKKFYRQLLDRSLQLGQLFWKLRYSGIERQNGVLSLLAFQAEPKHFWLQSKLGLTWYAKWVSNSILLNRALLSCQKWIYIRTLISCWRHAKLVFLMRLWRWDYS